MQRDPASAAPTSSTCRPSATTALDGRLQRDDRLRGGRRARRAHDLRADAALEDAHAGPLLHRRPRPSRSPRTCARASSSCCSRRPTRARPRRSCCRSSSAAGGEVGAGLLPRLRARARRSRQPAAGTCATRRSSSPASPTSACAARSCSTSQIVDTVVPVSSTMVAETAKLHENTFRAVNIALANELALMCDRLGISAWEVIEAAATKPFAFLPHYPGPGLGGDCIPVVPHFLAWRLREYGYSAQLIDAAHEINAQHADLRRPEDRRRAQRRRPADQGLADPAARHGLQGRRARHARVAEPRGHAPAARARRRRRATATRGCPSSSSTATRHASVAVDRRGGREADCVVVLTPHREFLEQPLWDEAQLIVDTRNVVPRGARTSYSI